MFESPEILRMAHAMARHAASRQSVASTNIAHADTPGFRARDVVPFSEHYATLRSSQNALRATRAGHASFGPSDPSQPRLTETVNPGGGDPNGNTVSLETEMIRAAEARHQHELALGIYRSASNILRRCLGR